MSARRTTTAARALANVAGALAMTLAMTAVLAPATRAAAPGGGGETISCAPGQTANTDLGVCVDPVCGVGQERDPTGQTRYCVAIPCPPGQHLLQGTNTCVSTPPPPPRCPDGSVGTPHRLSTGVTIIDCPKQLPQGGSRPVTHPTGTSAGTRAP